MDVHAKTQKWPIRHYQTQQNGCILKRLWITLNAVFYRTEGISPLFLCFHTLTLYSDITLTLYSDITLTLHYKHTKAHISTAC